MDRCPRGCCESYRAHLLSVTLGAAPQQSTFFERQLDKDRPAYKRLREDGLQPPSVKGAAALESRAASRFEVESGRILPPDQQRRIDAAVKEAAQVTGT